MKSSPSTSFRRTGKTVLVAFACIFAITLVQLPAFGISTPTLQPLAEKAKTLPVKATFEKVKNDDGPPFILKLKNESNAPLEVTVTIYLSVLSHNRDKARHVPAQIIEAGKTSTIGDLAALDKVTVASPGFAPLELEVK